MKIKGRTAVVTGASMGIGAATAITLAKKGAIVYVAARSEDKLNVIAEMHPNIHPVVCDVTKIEDRANLIATAGEVDILVNNAGLATYGLLDSQPAEVVRQMFEVNVMALIDLTQRVLPGMLFRGAGHICNIGSTISHIAFPPMTVYAATKFAVEGFSDGLRREVGGRGIKISLIQPGPVKTAFWDRAMAGDRPDVDDRASFGIPPQWVANAVHRAIRLDHVPGFASVAVPRVGGLGFVCDLPVVSFLIDKGMVVPQIMQKHSPDNGGDDAEVIPLASAQRPRD